MSEQLSMTEKTSDESWWKAQEHFKSGEFEDAAREFERFGELSLDPKKKLLSHAMRGNMYTEAGEHDKAAQQYRLYIEGNPRSQRASESLFLRLCELDRLEEAVEEGLRYFNLVPSDSSVRTYRIEDYRSYGDNVIRVNGILCGLEEEPEESLLNWRAMAVLSVCQPLDEGTDKRCLDQLGNSFEKCERRDDAKTVRFESDGHLFMLCCGTTTAYLSSAISWRALFSECSGRTAFLNAVNLCEALLASTDPIIILSSCWQPSNWIEIDKLPLDSILSALQNDWGPPEDFHEPGEYDEVNYFLKPVGSCSSDRDESRM